METIDREIFFNRADASCNELSSAAAVAAVVTNLNVVMDNQQLLTRSERSGTFNEEGDSGALILFTSSTLVGSRINLIPIDAQHSQVRGIVCKHDLPQGVSFAAVYKHLRQGIYFIEGSDQKVTIASGRATTLDYLEECCRIYYHPATTSVLAGDF